MTDASPESYLPESLHDEPIKAKYVYELLYRDGPMTKGELAGRMAIDGKHLHRQFDTLRGAGVLVETPIDGTRSRYSVTE